MSIIDWHGVQGQDGNWYYPYINQQTGTWWIFDEGEGVYVDSDISAIGPKGDMGPRGYAGIQGEKGRDGTSVQVTGVDESGVDGGTNYVNFSDGTTLKVKNGNTGAKGDPGRDGVDGLPGSDGATGPKGPKGDKGDPGVPVTVLDVSETYEDGGANVVVFSDGTTLSVRNGNTGKQGVRGIQGKQGPKGDSYVLTQDDMVEIANIATEMVDMKVEEGVAEIEAKGEETLNSIPDDYTELSNVLNAVTENTINLWELGDVGPFERSSGYKMLSAPLVKGKTYTFTADVESNDTYSTDCRVYLAGYNPNEYTFSTSFLIERGLRKSATFTVPDVEGSTSIYQGFVFYASRTNTQSAGDTAKFSNIQLQEGEKSTAVMPHKTAVDSYFRLVEEKTDNLWTHGDLSFTKTSDKVYFGTTLEHDTDYTFSADIVSDDTYSPDCRIYLVNSNDNTMSEQILIGRGSNQSVTFHTSATVDIIGLIIYASRTSSQSEDDTATFKNIVLVKGKSRGVYYPNNISSIDYTARDLFNRGVFPVVEKTKWLAIGDSITYGVFSDSSGSKDSQDGWVNRLAKALNYDLNNQGVRGMGYCVAGSDSIYLTDVLTAVEAYTDDYSLVTVALGINDYNTSSVTISDLESAITSCISRLSTKFPSARIVFITPFNSNRRGQASDNYCYGYNFDGKTLKQVADKIQECCLAVGVECIYASQGFLFNNYNMSTMLPDQTHPSFYAHTLIAKNMVHYLLF